MTHFPNLRPMPKGYPTTWKEARERFEAWRDNPRRRSDRCKIDASTYLVERVGQDYAKLYAVRLYDTDIVTFDADDGAVVSSGGFQTPTTRGRIAACGFMVGMSGGVVGIVDRKGRWRTFMDGIRLGSRGGVLYPAGYKVRELDDARRLRRANLRAARKSGASVWRWDNRSGGMADKGNAPEAFKD